MALTAGKSVFSEQQFCLESISIPQALELPSDIAKTVQLKLIPETDKSYHFEIYSLDFRESKWTLNARGKIICKSNISVPSNINLARKPPEFIEAETYYKMYREKGINYGKSFQVIHNIWIGKGQALGQIRLLEPESSYLFHPIILDACLQVAGASLIQENLQKTYLPVGLERFTSYTSAHNLTQFYAYAQVRLLQPILTADVQLITLDGQVIATLEGLQVSPINSPKNILQDWLYQIEWQLKKLSKKSSNYLLKPETIYAGLKPELTVQSGLKNYQKLLSQLESASVIYILEAFAQLGYEFKPKTHFKTFQITQQLEIIKRHERLFNRLLEILAEEGILRQTEENWEVIQSPTEIPLENIQKSAELSLLEHCGSHLAQVLIGKCEPIELLFPQGDLSIITELYQNSLGAKSMNTLVQKSVLKALENKSSEQHIKILEVGAGTGGTTSYLLPHLDAIQTEYVFTDISLLFTTKAQQKFQNYPFVKYQILDIEKDLQSQGFSLHKYDLIVAANVLHATQDLQKTLSHTKQLLAPQGILILLEGTRPLRWLDLIFGLTEGWWRFTDTQIRSSYPLVSANQWQELLENTGFKETVALSFKQEWLDQQSIIIAQNEEDLQKDDFKNWLIFADTQGIAEQLAKGLQVKKDDCRLVFANQINNATEIKQLLQEQPSNNILYLWGLDAPDAENLSVEMLDTTSKKLCKSLLNIVQTLSESKHLWLVTRDAVAIEKTTRFLELYNLQYGVSGKRSL